jgi:hypothetical protein
VYRCVYTVCCGTDGVTYMQSIFAPYRKKGIFLLRSKMVTMLRNMAEVSWVVEVVMAEMVEKAEMR